MTIDQAIEILADIAERPSEDWLDFEYFSIKLGIEALKYIQKERYSDFPHHIPPLLGEDNIMTKVVRGSDDYLTKT